MGLVVLRLESWLGLLEGFEGFSVWVHKLLLRCLPFLCIVNFFLVVEVFANDEDVLSDCVPCLRRGHWDERFAGSYHWVSSVKFGSHRIVDFLLLEDKHGVVRLSQFLLLGSGTQSHLLVAFPLRVRRDDLSLPFSLGLL